MPVLDFPKTESRTSAKNEEVSLVFFNKAEEAVAVQRVMTQGLTGPMANRVSACLDPLFGHTAELKVTVVQEKSCFMSYAVVCGSEEFVLMWKLLLICGSKTCHLSPDIRQLQAL